MYLPVTLTCAQEFGLGNVPLLFLFCCCLFVFVVVVFSLTNQTQYYSEPCIKVIIKLKLNLTM